MSFTRRNKNSGGIFYSWIKSKVVWMMRGGQECREDGGGGRVVVGLLPVNSRLAPPPHPH